MRSMFHLCIDMMGFLYDIFSAYGDAGTKLVDVISSACASEAVRAGGRRCFDALFRIRWRHESGCQVKTGKLILLTWR